MMNRFAGCWFSMLVAVSTVFWATPVAMAQVVELPAQAYGASRPIPQRYIVVFTDRVAHPAAEAARLMRGRGGEIHHTYSHAIRGFAATIPDRAYQAIRMNPNVAYVEPDFTISLSATQSSPAWGLDRVDQRDLPLDKSYRYDFTGKGIHAFVIDTGIRTSHNEFAGRIGPGFTAISDGRGTSDCNGHGTHVAGTLGGTVYGVAKEVTLVPVRVLDCEGAGTGSGVIAGVDYAAKDSRRPAVANLSLGGGAYQALDDAVKGAVGRGVTMVVAAGNSNANACNYSPAREPTAVTVGATTSSDARASYSNFGSCLDLFAPGSSITSAWYSGNTATRTLSGTSMAAPHVAGVAALVLQGNADATPAQVTDLILSSATTGKVTSAGTGSPGLLAYSFVAGSASPTPNAGPVARFTAKCTDLVCDFDATGSSDSDGTIVSYAWSFGDGTTGTGVRSAHTYAAGGTYAVALTAADDAGATGTATESVTLTAPANGSDGPTVSGAGIKTGSSWTAQATLHGTAGDSTAGTWNYNSVKGGCQIAAGATSCSFGLTRIPNRVGSVTYTDATRSALTVTVAKP